MKTKILFLFIALFSLNAFALVSDDDNGQDGNGSDYIVSLEEKRLCKYVFSELKNSTDYTVFTYWKGEHIELTKIEIETKCCEINPSKCENQTDTAPGPMFATEASDQ